MAARRATSGKGGSASVPEADRAGDGALSFEQALEKLEGLVDRLDSGDLPLEQALSAFEQGVALTRRCAEQLDDAERRIEVLTREGDELVARPFEASEGEE